MTDPMQTPTASAPDATPTPTNGRQAALGARVGYDPVSGRVIDGVRFTAATEASRIRGMLASGRDLDAREELEEIEARLQSAIDAAPLAAVSAAAPDEREVLDFLDEMNTGGHISYGDYSHLHALINALAARPAPTHECEQEYGTDRDGCVVGPLPCRHPEHTRPAPVVSGEALAQAWAEGLRRGIFLAAHGRGDEFDRDNPYRTVADAPATEPAPFFRDITTGEPCPRSGPVLCTITDRDHLHKAIHMDAPAADDEGGQER